MKKIKNAIVVAIDGPAGAGKSTIAKIVARELGYLYIDTGAMYRAITWKAIQQKINLHDSRALVRLSKETKIKLQPDFKKHQLHVFVDEQDVTHKIRSEKVSLHTNAVASIRGIRLFLINLQREMAAQTSVVMEGRDIGTDVFPNANIKFYLDASPLERARRRYEELKAKGKRVKLEKIAHAIAQRDYRDKHRKVSPLRIAHDAIVLDSTHLTLEQVAKNILQNIELRISVNPK